MYIYLYACLFCRRKRKWDQPAESLIPAVPGVLSFGNVGSLIGMAPEGVPAASAVNKIPFSTGALIAPALQQHAVALVQKISQVRYLGTSLLHYLIFNTACK